MKTTTTIPHEHTIDLGVRLEWPELVLSVAVLRGRTMWTWWVRTPDAADGEVALTCGWAARA